MTKNLIPILVPEDPFPTQKVYREYSSIEVRMWTSLLAIGCFTVAPLEHDNSLNQYNYCKGIQIPVFYTVEDWIALTKKTTLND